MADQAYEFNPVTRITVGALGEPGHRVFVLQASREGEILNIKLEKQQVAALAQGIDRMLDDLEQREVQRISALEEPPPQELELQIPADPTLVAVQLALALEAERGQMMLRVEAVKGDLDSEELRTVVARLWADLPQMRALSRLAQQVVSQGRPICPLCGQPMDPEGHFCPRSNGHGTHPHED